MWDVWFNSEHGLRLWGTTVHEQVGAPFGRVRPASVNALRLVFLGPAWLARRWSQPAPAGRRGTGCRLCRHLAEDRKTLPARVDRRAISWSTAAAVLSAVVGGAAVVLLAWFPVLGVGDRGADLSTVKAVPRPVNFVIFDHLTYLSIARNVQDGASAFVEPFTGTGSSIYPAGYYWTMGEVARVLDLDVPTVWNVFGMLLIVGLVAMCAAWALWTARGTHAYALAAVPLVVGTLAWWADDGAWLGLYHQMSVVLWAPWAILVMGTSEGAAMLLFGVALLTTAAMLVSQGRRRLVLALASGVLVGLLFHVHAYVAIFAALVVVATLVAADMLERPSARWAAASGAGVLLLLVLMRTDVIGVEATTKIALLIVLVAAMLVAKPGWLARMWAPGLALALSAVLIAAPVFVRLLREAGDENSFFYARQHQNDVRDLTLPVSSFIVHELPVWVLGVAAAAGLWRIRRQDPRRTPWLAALLALLVVTPLLTYNHLWGVDQEPYRFLPYGALFICVLGVPWLWLAVAQGDVPTRATAAVAVLLLAATIPTTVAHARAVNSAGLVPSPPEVTSAYARIDEVTGGGLTLLDTCFTPQNTRVFGGPNVVQYHAGLAFPAHLDQVNAILAALHDSTVPARADLSTVGVGWFATHTNCRGIGRAEIRRRFGRPAASFLMLEPSRYGHPPGTRYEVYRVS